MKTTKVKMPTLERAIKILEKNPNAFQIKLPAREGKRLLASFAKLAAPARRKRRTK
jgi:hypothetical protein